MSIKGTGRHVFGITGTRSALSFEFFVRRDTDADWTLFEPGVPVLLSGITFTRLLAELGFDVAPETDTIPAISTLGLVVMAVVVLGAGTVVLSRSKRMSRSPQAPGSSPNAIPSRLHAVETTEP